MKAFAYVDGFNLYYRALKNTPHRWLDLDVLLSRVYPRFEFATIRYFTARVKPGPRDPDQRTRQEVYLRALRTLPNLRIHYGHFTSHRVWLPYAEGDESSPRFAEVVKTEEKGSDVNLAAHLVNDAHLRAFDVAIVVTNDSDLVEPIRIVTNQIRLRVGVLNPCRQPAGGLKKAASFYRILRPSILRKAHFPAVLTDSRGRFSKPENW